MPTRCKICLSEHGRAVDQKLRAGESATSIAAWLSAQGEAVSRVAVGRHSTAHLALAPRAPGPAPMTGNFLQNVVGLTEQRMASGELQPSMRDGLTAQKLLDDRSEKFADRELTLRLAQVLGGATPPELIEGNYREVPDWEKAIDAEIALLTAGATVDPEDAPRVTWDERRKDAARSRLRDL